MLLLINIKQYEPRKVVQYFEVVKEKAPELVLSFDQLLVIGKAYRDINEYERAIIVWRGLIEASYLEDARVGELLRQRGKTLEAMAYLIDLWRSYPNTPSIESDFFGLSQVLAEARRRRRSPTRTCAASWPTAGVTRSELLLQTIRMIQIFLAQSPTNPMADEASLALVGAFLELEDYQAVVKLAGPVRQALPQEHVTSTASSTARPWPTSTWASTTGRSRWPRRSPRPSTRTPAGPTSPAPTSGRRSTSSARSSTPAGSPARPWSTTARSPTGSPTRPAPSSSTRART